MAQIIVRNLDDEVRDQLRKLATSRGQSMEEVVREILRQAVLKPNVSQDRLGSRIAARFTAIGLKEEIAELRGNELAPPSFET